MTLLEFFLRRNGLYNIYIQNIYEYNVTLCSNYTLKDAEQKLKTIKRISSGFAWSGTKQGYVFWSKKEFEYEKLRTKYFEYQQYNNII